MRITSLPATSEKILMAIKAKRIAAEERKQIAGDVLRVLAGAPQ